MQRGGGFDLHDAARLWLLARCSTVVASCLMQRSGGFLPDAARRWLLARARDYIPAAVPSGAAQEVRYPAGTLGDIQAVAP